MTARYYLDVEGLRGWRSIDVPDPPPLTLRVPAIVLDDHDEPRAVLRSYEVRRVALEHGFAVYL